MSDKKKVKGIMSKNKDIIQENTPKRLFGEKLDEKITEHVKLKKRSPGSFSTSLATNAQIIQLIMATIISLFEGAPSFNRIEVGGKAISLAIIKTTTDWPTGLVNQN